MNNNLVRRLLERRNIVNPYDIDRFLYGGVKDLFDPHLIGNMSEACELILYHIAQGEKIIIFGDYDVDGITGTSILYLTLKELGANVYYRLPDRISEGYGMSKSAVIDIANNGFPLIITIDNGISCIEEIDLAKEYNMKVIVVDHHIPSGNLPKADVIVNPLLDDYPFKGLAGCGLALKMSCLLYSLSGYDFSHGYRFLDLAAIGTVADRVPMIDENRIIVKEGLRYINHKTYDRLGVIELIGSFGLKHGRISADDIGYKLAPAINAPGRLNKNGADDSLELLICMDPDKCVDLSYKLYQVNQERKEATSDGYAKAIKYIEDNNLSEDKILVVFLPDILEGIVGIIAGKITEHFSRPSLVITEADDCFKGSARSIESFDIFDAINNCGYLFAQYGGHSQAAGMVLEKDLSLIERLRYDINAYATSIVPNGHSVIDDIDDELSADSIDFKLAILLDKLAPFGCGNPKPLFLVKNYTTVKCHKDGEWTHYTLMGSNKEHLKVYGKDYNVVGFEMSDLYKGMDCPKMFDFKGHVSIDYYMEKPRLFVEILDIIQKEKKLNNSQSDMSKEMQSMLNTVNL